VICHVVIFPCNNLFLILLLGLQSNNLLAKCHTVKFGDREKPKGLAVKETVNAVAAELVKV
jgi:hypothetical protein